MSGLQLEQWIPPPVVLQLTLEPIKAELTILIAAVTLTLKDPTPDTYNFFGKTWLVEGNAHWMKWTQESDCLDHNV